MPRMGVGWSRLPAAGGAVIGAKPAEPEPFEGQPPQFSPEQTCLDVGRNRARAHFAWAKAFCAVVFLLILAVRQAGATGNRWAGQVV